MKKSGGLDNRLKMILIAAIIVFIVAVVVSMFSSPDYSPSVGSQKVNSVSQNSRVSASNTLAKSGSSPTVSGKSPGVLRGGVFVCDMWNYAGSGNGTGNGSTYQGCFGDVDNSGVVNAGDRGFIAANLGSTNFDNICKYDLDGNGVINPADRGYVSANIGRCTVLPDYQDGSGLNHGVPDTRFGSQPPVNLTHLECRNQMCELVQGNGTNECTTNADCNTTVINVTADFNVYRSVGAGWQLVNPTTSYVFGEGEQVWFQSISTGGVTSLSWWNLGDGNIVTGLDAVFHRYYPPTNTTNGTVVTYPVRLTAVAGGGQSDFVVKSVRVRNDF